MEVRQETRKPASAAPTIEKVQRRRRATRGVKARSSRGCTPPPPHASAINVSAAFCTCDSVLFTLRRAHNSCSNTRTHTDFSVLGAFPFEVGKMEAPGKSTELTRSFLSYRMLKEVLETSNIKDDEEVRCIYSCIRGLY